MVHFPLAKDHVHHRLGETIASVASCAEERGLGEGLDRKPHEAQLTIMPLHHAKVSLALPSECDPPPPPSHPLEDVVHCMVFQ